MTDRGARPRLALESLLVPWLGKISVEGAKAPHPPPRLCTWAGQGSTAHETATRMLTRNAVNPEVGHRRGDVNGS